MDRAEIRRLADVAKQLARHAHAQRDPVTERELLAIVLCLREHADQKDDLYVAWKHGYEKGKDSAEGAKETR